MKLWRSFSDACWYASQLNHLLCLEKLSSVSLSVSHEHNPWRWLTGCTPQERCTETHPLESSGWLHLQSALRFPIGQFPQWLCIREGSTKRQKELKNQAGKLRIERMEWRLKKGIRYSNKARSVRDCVRGLSQSRRAFHHLFPIKATWKHLAALEQLGTHCLRRITFATCFSGRSLECNPSANGNIGDKIKIYVKMETRCTWDARNGRAQLKRPRLQEQFIMYSVQNGGY